jgi:ABC-type xylose transport system permease subunit
MLYSRGARLAVAISAGLALGAVLGRAVGLGLRSDNMPFFIGLGALAGIIVGLVAGYAMVHYRSGHS